MSAFTINTPNGAVSGAETGDGPPVVLIAGLGSTSSIWGNLPAVMGRRFRVITLDNRGVGGSREGRPFTLRATAEDLEAVLDARKVDRAHLVGASMGGIIALEFALTHPDRVLRQVVVSSAAHLSIHGRRLLELFQDLLVYAPPERAGAALMTLAFAPPFHERFSGFVNEATDLYGLDEADLQGTLLQVEHLLEGWDLRDRLPSLKAPTLVLSGARDPIVASEDTAELAAALPNARLVEVRTAAHSVLAEGGEAALEQTTAFLSEQPPEETIV